MKKLSPIFIGTACGLVISSAAFAIITSRFDDVPSDHFALEAIEWATEERLVKGDDNANTFRPDDAVSRAELVTVLRRYDEKMMRELSPNKAFFDEIEKLLASGASIEEVDDPGFEFPEGVQEGQIAKFFQMGDLYFALPLTSSMNFPLPGPIDRDKSFGFVGVLVAEKNDSTWGKLLEINSVDYPNSTKNNPYYLWVENGKLFLNIIDDNGAGSTEGNAKLYSTQNGAQWILEECYYFGPSSRYPNYGSGEEFEDAYKLSSRVEKFYTNQELVDLEILPLEHLDDCKDDVELVNF